MAIRGTCARIICARPHLQRRRARLGVRGGRGTRAGDRARGVTGGRAEYCTEGGGWGQRPPLNRIYSGAVGSTAGQQPGKMARAEVVVHKAQGRE